MRLTSATALGTDQFCRLRIGLMLVVLVVVVIVTSECNNVKPISRIPSQRLTDTSNKYIDNNDPATDCSPYSVNQILSFSFN